MSTFKYLKNDKYYSKLYNSTKNENLLKISGYFEDQEYVINQEDLNKALTPIHKLKKVKTLNPIVLLTTGAFNPLHEGHINIMDNAWKTLEKRGYEVIGGYFSPANDSCVSQKVMKNYEIEKRLEYIFPMIENTPYMCSLFASLSKDFELNFTSVIEYLELYLQKHYHKNIKVCYVYGSDNENFGYLFHYNDLLACCVERKNFHFNHIFKNVLNISNNPNSINSTEIRNNIKSFEKKIKNIYLKDDFVYSLKYIDIKNINLKYEIFKSSLIFLFKKYFDNVEIINNEKFSLLFNKNILSIDEINKGNYNLEVTRVFNYDFYNKKPLKLSNRVNSKKITKQLESQNLINTNILLFDDDSYSGFTINSIKKILNKHNIIIDKIIFNQNINSTFEDICDIRDFLIGSNGSGLTIQYKNKKYKLPYIFPFVNVSLRSSLKYENIIEFSKEILRLNLEFYKNENIKLIDINNNLYLFFKNFGIKKEITMEDFINYLLNYFK